jgi:alanine-glyoxylate transaminase/(R)-3-amino-2-methylpropionate-pyruvate transaminase
MTDLMRPPLAMPEFSYTPTPYQGPPRAEVLALRQRYVNPALFTLYREPLMIVEGKMQYLFDETGRRYLDLFAGIVTVSCGHCHPKVIGRVQAQTARLQHATTIYLHPNLPLLAEKLASKMPPAAKPMISRLPWRGFSPATPT